MGVKVVSVAQQSNEPAPNGSFLPSTPSMLSSIIIAPPLGVDNQVDYFRGAGIKQKNILARVFDILKGAKPGADLSSIGVPPVFNLPKSHVQCFSEQVYCCGQNLLEQCTDGASSLDRFLAVVRWHLSLVRPAHFSRFPTTLFLVKRIT